ncbi:MAG: CDP-glycerol glycerophosphotransferase family protein, partial [Bacilli bacterium]|nr:CDP-glycerol glycerophosphotransferase family protein [Bacilli bacterium]
MLIYLYKYHLKFIYFFLKFLPINKNKIVFLSRQTDAESLDFTELRLALEKKGYTIKVLANRMKKGIKNKIRYNFHIYKQMYYIATSKVCVIDSYIIPVCVLRHKKELYVLQIWHSLGKIKKSGYQTLGFRNSKSFFDFENNKKTALIMNMHKNYDNIIAGGKSFNKFYAEGFNCDEKILLNYGLPRADVLLRNNSKIKKEINKNYPVTTEKLNVCYFPTFRKYKVKEIEDFTKDFDFEKFNLIIRTHPNQKIDFEGERLLNLVEYSTIDLISIADYVITDYSAVSLEAAVLNKKIIYYIFDHEKYLKENGMNLDPLETMPYASYKNKKNLFEALK